MIWSYTDKHTHYGGRDMITSTVMLIVTPITLALLGLIAADDMCK